MDTLAEQTFQSHMPNSLRQLSHRFVNSSSPTSQSSVSSMWRHCSALAAVMLVTEESVRGKVIFWYRDIIYVWRKWQIGLGEEKKWMRSKIPHRVHCAPSSPLHSRLSQN